MTRPQYFFVRCVLIGVAVLVVGWAITTFFATRELAALSQVTQRIKRAERIELDTLAPLLGYLDRTDAKRRGCRDPSSGHAGIIRQYAAAVAQRSSPDLVAPLLRKARLDLEGHLSCSPHDAFAWYELFWVRLAQGDKVSDIAPLLGQSYRLGAREGAIALFRSDDALSVYDQLEPALQQSVKEEFLFMLRDRPDIAAGIFRAGSPSVREHLLAFTREAPLERRQEFAGHLDANDVIVQVPGVEYQDGRVIRN